MSQDEPFVLGVGEKPEYGYAKHEYTIRYASEQIDPRSPLWYKRFYVGVCLALTVFGIVVGAGAIYNDKKCTVPGNSSYQSATLYLGYILIVASILMMVFALYLLIDWRRIWCKTVPIPAKKPVYGEDVEDISPGYLASSGTRTFLDASKYASDTRREADLAVDDIEKTEYGSRFRVSP